MIIDFHSHVYPDKIAPHALAHMQALSHNAFSINGTAAALKASMAKAGICHNVILPVATNPDKVPHINNVSIQSTGKDGLIYFGCIHPDFPDYKQELKRLSENGINGIKIHPLYQGTDIDDIRYLRILGTAAELGMIVVIHSGLDPAFPGDVHAAPKMTRHALEQIGPMKMVCAHMGGLFNWDDVLTYLAPTNVYIDTSFALGKMIPAEENYYTEEELQLLTDDEFCNMVKVFGPDRVLFGTDSPWNDQKATVDAINALPLSDDTKAHIFYQNAQKLLGLQGQCDSTEV